MTPVFAASAEKKSNGQLKIEVFADPEIVGMFQVPEAVQAGTLDLSMGSGGLWGGVIPVGDVEFSLPYAYRIPEKKTFIDKGKEVRRFVFESGFLDILRDEYAKHGLHVSGRHPDTNLIEIMELDRKIHPFFIGTQAHPEFRSRLGSPNPLFDGLIAAATEFSKDGDR